MKFRRAMAALTVAVATLVPSIALTANSAHAATPTASLEYWAPQPGNPWGRVFFANMTKLGDGQAVRGIGVHVTNNTTMNMDVHIIRFSHRVGTMDGHQQLGWFWNGEGDITVRPGTNQYIIDAKTLAQPGSQAYVVTHVELLVPQPPGKK